MFCANRPKRAAYVMVQGPVVMKFSFRLPMILSAVALVAACAAPQQVELPKLSDVDIDPERQALAIREVAALRSQGKRAWCVPFARNLSGIQIRGNAHTWWAQADGLYPRSNDPKVGAVMVFSKSSRLSLGHVAVVSEVVDDRHILINHANWSRNKVSLRMGVIDISDAGDWSKVRVESNPGAYGSPYPVSGFIHPKADDAI